MESPYKDSWPGCVCDFLLNNNSGHFQYIFVFKTLIHAYKDTGFQKKRHFASLSLYLEVKKQISVNLNIKNRTLVIILQVFPHF